MDGNFVTLMGRITSIEDTDIMINDGKDDVKCVFEFDEFEGIQVTIIFYYSTIRFGSYFYVFWNSY